MEDGVGLVEGDRTHSRRPDPGDLGRQIDGRSRARVLLQGSSRCDTSLAKSFLTLEGTDHRDPL